MDYKSLAMDVLQFENSSELEKQLAKKIAYELEIAIHQKGFAHFLVSGGTTPIGLFQQLSQMEIEWKNVTVGLIDERWVDSLNPSSNELLIKTHLLQNKASKATFLGMVMNTTNEIENLEIANQNYLNFIMQGVDIAVLGMGEDGHTASLFPNDPNSDENLKNGTKKKLISTLAPNEPKKRISCSKELILSSKHLFLMIVGQNKLEVFEKAVLKQLPISYFSSVPTFKTYYSDKK